MTHRIDVGSGPPPESVLPPPPPEAVAALDTALAADDPKQAVARVVARFPRFMAAWASLGDLSNDPVESYAYYRIGYHRGLDALRAGGWRGSGYVRWGEETNRGFLRALEGLGRRAADIEESDEVERIADFLRQLDPDFEPG